MISTAVLNYLKTNLNNIPDEDLQDRIMEFNVWRSEQNTIFKHSSHADNSILNMTNALPEYIKENNVSYNQLPNNSR